MVFGCVRDKTPVALARGLLVKLVLQNIGTISSTLSARDWVKKFPAALIYLLMMDDQCTYIHGLFGGWD